MKCWEGDQWQCDEARITEHVSVRSVLRLWKLTDKLRRGGVCVLGGKDWSWMVRKEWMEGEGREVVRDHGVRRWQTRRQRCAQHAVTGANRRGLPAKASWGHPGTRSARHIKSASPCMKPFVQQNPAWPAPPPFTPDASHRTQLISKHLMSLRQENRPPLNLPAPRPHPALRGRRDGTLQGLMMLQRPQ